MEVVTHPMKRLPPPPPFQRRDVEEWSHLDSVTGARETGRVETGRWAATTSNSSHHFGQVVDLRARNRADGSQEQRRQKKQLEVFQASIPGGSVQVIRSQTTTSSWHGQSTSSSKLDSGMSFGWSHAMNNSSSNSQTKSIEKRSSDEPTNQNSRFDDKSGTGSRIPDMHFENLQLAIHPLDLSPQKTKATIGRSGSISGRRPPTRPRSIAGTGQSGGGSSDTNSKTTTTMKDEQQQRWQSSSASSLITKSTSTHSETTKSVFGERENILNPVSLFSITGNRGDVDLFPVRLGDEGNNRKKLFRMKSCSSEDLRLSPDSNHEDTNVKMADEWRRDSLERRSLQLPPVQPKVGLEKRQTNVTRSRFEAQNSMKHTFVSTDSKSDEKQSVIDRLKGNGWQSIENVLRKNLNNHSSLDSFGDGMVSPADEERVAGSRSVSSKKKNRFITVESLNEVRGRLRRTDSFSELLPGVERSNENIAVEQVDDGILTQSSTSVNDVGKSDSKSVKSFVYGIETVLQGDRRTGSLESRGNNKIDGSNGLTTKTEEWYNRRKSYGFEPVRQQQQHSIANRYSTNANTKMNLAESTDSGICRSSETVANTSTPWYNPPANNKYTDNNESRRTSHTITIKNSFNYDNLLNDSKPSSRIELLSKGIGSKGKKTVVTVGNDDQDNWRTSSGKEDSDENVKDSAKFESTNGISNVNTANSPEAILKDDEKVIVPRGKVADALRSLREKSSLINSFAAKRLSEPITISIPSPVDDSESTDANDFLLKQTKDPLEGDRYKLKKFLDNEAQNVQTSYSKLIFGEGKIKSLSKSFDGQSDSEFNGNHEITSTRFNLRPVSKMNQPEFKRHSIAVDETKYITNKNKDDYELSSAVNENSNFRLNSHNTTFVPPYTSKLKTSDLKGESSGDNDSNDKKQKKVEFCKTEVHFAAEPGRFNIVETDGKPPSNMNFRRRRKTISESTPRNNSNLPEIRFGDLHYEKSYLTNKNDNLDEAFDIHTIQKEENSIATVPKDEVITILPETIHSVKSSVIKENGDRGFNSGVLDDSDSEKTLDFQDNPLKPRSILKNNVGPLTSNKNMLEAGDSQFFVVNEMDKINTNQGITRLNPSEDSFNRPGTFLDHFPKSSEVSEHYNSNRSSSKTTITDLKSRSDCEEQVETELQKLLKSLRPTPRKSLFLTDDELSDSGSNYSQPTRFRTAINDHNSSMAADNGLAVHISSKPSWRSPSSSENSKKIEEYKTRGFSTRVNFGSEETMVVNSDPSKQAAPVEQLASTYSSEVASRLLTQPSNVSDNNAGIQQDGNAVSTTTHIRFNAAPDLDPCLTTNKNNEITIHPSSKSHTVVNTSNENENITSASLVLKMLLNRAANSRRRDVGGDKKGGGLKSDVIEEDRTLESHITVMKPATTQLYNASVEVQSDLINFKCDKSSPSTEQRMMKTINSQHKQHLDLIKEMDRFQVSSELNCDVVESRSVAQLAADERDERLSRISNDSILEALENLSKQIEIDIIEIPKVKEVVKNREKPTNSVFKVIEDSKDVRMKRVLRRRTDSTLSQSQLSDDTLQADEEVKSYMSAVSDVRKMSDSSDTDEEAARKSKNCDRLTNFNRRPRRLVRNRTKEPCTSQFDQGIISQLKNTLPDDISKGQTTTKHFNDPSNDKLNSDSAKSVETLVSTRSGHPRITSISLRYNDNHETNGTTFDPPSANKKYSKNSICIEPCDTSTGTSDISSSWKWSKGSKQSVRTSTQNISLNNIYSNARGVETTPIRDDITTGPEADKTPTLSYPATKSTHTDPKNYQQKQVVKSTSDQCVLLSRDKPQFGKVTAVVPPTMAYSSSVTLNYTNVHQPSSSQDLQTNNDNLQTQQQSQRVVTRLQQSATTSTNIERKRGSSKVENDKNRTATEQRNVDKYRRNVNVSSSSVMNSRRDSWLNLPKDVSTNQQQDRQAREVRVDKQRKKQSNIAVELRKKKKSDDNASIDGCSDDLSPSKGRESPIYANSRVFTHEYSTPTCSDRVETESFILEELTKAADEILRAVNGYTDDDSSFKGSSDDETGKRYDRDRKFSSKPLGTISEAPTKKESKSQVVESKVRSAAVKNRLCKTSSNSSVEGGGSSADSKPLILEKPPKRRNVRLLQRASSREMLMKSRTAASSSEDVQSGSEQPAPRAARTKTSRHTSHQKSTIASQSRTKERVQKTVSSADNSSVRAQSTVISAASTRTRHDARKKSTTKSRTSTASSVTGARRLAVGERLTPEGAEQQSTRKETNERVAVTARTRAVTSASAARGLQPHPSRPQQSKKKLPSSTSQPGELMKL